MLYSNKCHVCGTFGKKWQKERDVFFCPNCLSIYSNFGVIVDSRKSVETLTFWS